MVIIVTGSVGAGKTTIAKKIAEKLKWEYVDVNEVIKKNKLNKVYDKERKCYEIDVKKLNKVLIKIIDKDNKVVIDSHLSHYLPKQHVDLCVVVTCDIKTLRKRLKERNYDAGKIKENVDAELFNVCMNEAMEEGHNIIVVDSKKPNLGFLKTIK